jgi:NDP-4-keto-2,6-dideoxyhexose 3-C-methyltransferase
MYKQVTACRICGNHNLQCILDLGSQTLTGVFPKNKDPLAITSGPLRLVKCVGEGVCGLVQLEHSYDLGEMYGLNYGYRSGLNQSMVEHLRNKVDRICNSVELKPGDLVLDIGSNDSTTLQCYPNQGLHLVGIDPTGVKFSSFYPAYIDLIPDFFSAKLVKQKFPDKKAKIVTSFSMFYDLEDPTNFMQQVFEVLDDDGVWVFEQSYLPAMLATNSFDTVCHEHLEFYTLKQIKWMADRVGFAIIDVEFNDINGGSFSVTVSKQKGSAEISPKVKKILDQEVALDLDTLKPFTAFAEGANKARNELLKLIEDINQRGQTIYAIGASTKGNVLLQYYGISDKQIPMVGEVNPEKYNCYTPGSWILIGKEDDVLLKNPDYLLILPWHFRKFFIDNPKFAGTKLIFPLPDVQVVEIPSRA